TDLAFETGVQLILGDCLEDRALRIGIGIFGIERHVHCLSGDGNLVDFFPRPFEVRTTRLDHANLWKAVTLSLFRPQTLGDWIVQCGRVPYPFSATEAGLHGALVLIDRVNAGRQITDEEPSDESNNASENDVRHSEMPRFRKSNYPDSRWQTRKELFAP